MRRSPSWLVVAGLLLSLLACGQPVAEVRRVAMEPSATPRPPTATATATLTPVPLPTVTPVPPPPTATTRLPTATSRPPTVTQAPTQVPTRAVVASARPQATATRPRTPTPFGDRPAGWKTYTGTTLPFTMYYPPDWLIEDSSVTNGYIAFVAPEDYAIVLIGTTGRQTTATADQLRDEYFNEVLANCVKKGIDITRDNSFSGITFKSIGATCNEANDPTLYYYYIGLGLNNNVPWRFRFYSTYAEYSQNVEDYFFPMISSLNIFGNP